MDAAMSFLPLAVRLPTADGDRIVVASIVDEATGLRSVTLDGVLISVCRLLLLVAFRRDVIRRDDGPGASMAAAAAAAALPGGMREDRFGVFCSKKFCGGRGRFRLDLWRLLGGLTSKCS